MTLCFYCWLVCMLPWLDCKLSVCHVELHLKCLVQNLVHTINLQISQCSKLRKLLFDSNNLVKVHLPSFLFPVFFSKLQRKECFLALNLFISYCIAHLPTLIKGGKHLYTLLSSWGFLAKILSWMNVRLNLPKFSSQGTESTLNRSHISV